MQDNYKQKTEREKILDNIKRIKGQLGGIEKMIIDKKYCLSIIQQISAVKSALSAIAVKLLTEESCECNRKNNKENFEKIIKNLVNNI